MSSQTLYQITSPQPIDRHLWNQMIWLIMYVLDNALDSFLGSRTTYIHDPLSHARWTWGVYFGANGVPSEYRTYRPAALVVARRTIPPDPVIQGLINTCINFIFHTRRCASSASASIDGSLTTYTGMDTRATVLHTSSVQATSFVI